MGEARLWREYPQASLSTPQLQPSGEPAMRAVPPGARFRQVASCARVRVDARLVLALRHLPTQPSLQPAAILLPDPCCGCWKASRGFPPPSAIRNPGRPANQAIPPALTRARVKALFSYLRVFRPHDQMESQHSSGAGRAARQAAPAQVLRCFSWSAAGRGGWNPALPQAILA